MMKNLKPYHDFGADHYEQEYRNRVVRNLNHQAVRLGFRLEPAAPPIFPGVS